MNEMTSLFKDVYLWSGLALLASSVFGMFWVLKALQKHSEENESILIPVPEAAPEAPFARFEKAKEPQAPRIEKPRSGDETQLLRASPTEESLPLDRLSEQLIHLEKKLNKMSEQLEQIRREKTPPEDGNAGAQQSLKPAPEGKPDPDQLSQLSAKMDKIYNVLVTLSRPDTK